MRWACSLPQVLVFGLPPNSTDEDRSASHDDLVILAEGVVEVIFVHSYIYTRPYMYIFH